MIYETHATKCDICEMLEKGIKAAGAFYFAGVLAGLYYAGRRVTPLCPSHFATWKRLEENMKDSPLVDITAAQ